MNFECIKIPKHGDKRGFLIEFLSSPDLKNKKREFAQIYCATLAPGAWRGNHFHKTKEEWIVVMSGKVKLTIEDIMTHECREVILDSHNKDYILRARIGRNMAHLIENTGNSLAVIVAYTTEEYDPKNLDQWKYKVAR